MRSLTKVFADKLASVVAGVARKLVSEGAQLPDSVVSSIANAYMLLLQMVWYRIPNDSKVDQFIISYEPLVADALTLLKTNDFNAIVQTYRSIYTNLYTAKGGKRTYNLNQETAKEFIQNVLGGKVVVAKHVIKRQVKQVKTAPVANSLLLSLANQLAGVDTQTKPQAKPQVAVSKVKVEKRVPKVAGFFTELPADASIEDNTFVRITLTDNSKVFGRWHRIVSPNFEVAVLNKKGDVLAMKKKDVVSVATYTKATY